MARCKKAGIRAVLGLISEKKASKPTSALGLDAADHGIGGPLIATGVVAIRREEAAQPLVAPAPRRSRRREERRCPSPAGRRSHSSAPRSRRCLSAPAHGARHGRESP